MKRKRVLLLTIMTVVLSAGYAASQEVIPAKQAAPAISPPHPTPNDAVTSPEVGADRRVTFRLYAPNAREVKLQAEGMEATPGITAQEQARSSAGFAMTKAENGVWSIVFGPIQPGVYRYSFLVDNLPTVDPKNPSASESLNSVRSMYEVPGAPFMEYQQDKPHGAIAEVRYDSSAVNGLRRMHVYTPPGYENDSRRYPVLYLLHGGGDTDDSWPTVGRAGAILDNLIAAKQASPMIIVMPAGHISREFQLRTGMNTMGHDKFNEDLIESVIPYVDRHYRTMADRDHRSLAGLSMGGLQALTLSLTNSDLFSYIGIFSSGWFPQMRDQEEKTDLLQYKTGGQPFKLYWVGVGKLDIANANSAATVVLLSKYGIAPETHESEGFHAWNNWRDYLRVYAPRLFK
jgi:enterochelin esterase-like enzyme